MKKITKLRGLGFLFLLFTTLLFVNCNNEQLETTSDEGATTDDSALAAKGVKPVKDGKYFIKSRKSGKYLDVKGFSNKNGGVIHQWTKSGNKNQRWEVKSAGGSDFRIRSEQSKKSFEIKGNSKSNRGRLHQWAYDGDKNQKVTFRSVGGGYYAIIFKHSGKALDNTGKTSKGTQLHQWTYSKSNKNQHFSFEPVSGGGGNGGGGGGGNDDDDDDGGGGGGSGSAAAIIGGMGSFWKLNAFSGSLNVGRGSYGKSGSNGLSYKDRASNSDNNNWFFDTRGYAAFKCHVGNPTSSGSGNMRSELRELDGKGKEIEWNGTGSTNHRMRYKVNIRRMPTSGKLCFGQIHGQDDFDDVLRLQINDSKANRGSSSGKTSGTYDVQIKGYVTEELDRDNRNKNWAKIQMGRDYDVEISMKNKKVSVKLDGKTIYTSKSVNSKKNYFKAGAYLQSSQSDKSPQLKRNNNNFGEVWIKNMRVNH